MGRLMSLLATPNNVHESNLIYNYKFPTSISNNFNDNYYFCGYKCKKNNDKLIFEGDRFLNNLEFCNNLPALPISFASDGVKPINFDIYSHRNSFKIIQSDISNKIKLQFMFDADLSCQIDIFYCAFEKFFNGIFTYSLKPSIGCTFSSNHPPGPNQTYEYEFNNIENHDVCDGFTDNGELIPFVILLSTIDESCIDKQQFVTHLYWDSRSENQFISGAQVTVQKLVYRQTCFLIQEMYGAEPLTDPNINNSTSCKSSMNDIKGTYLTLESTHSNSKTKSDNTRNFLLQDCVICMATVRDTLLLPCRHLCLCNSCGEKLLHQSPACPICRCAFRALLQIENLDTYLFQTNLNDCN